MFPSFLVGTSASKYLGGCYSGLLLVGGSTRHRYQDESNTLVLTVDALGRDFASLVQEMKLALASEFGFFKVSRDTPGN